MMTKTKLYEAEGAIDAPKERRPGVPMELDPPRPLASSHWVTPERQPDPGTILKRKALSELTPVFGTSAPPHGLSGVMRRAAYGIAEHRTSHWFMLLLADRVDAFESRAGGLLTVAVVSLAAGGALAIALGRRRREPAWRRWIRR